MLALKIFALCNFLWGSLSTSTCSRVECFSKLRKLLSSVQRSLWRRPGTRMIFPWTPHMRTSTSLEDLETWSRSKNGLIGNQLAKVCLVCLYHVVLICMIWALYIFLSFTDEAWVGVYTLKDCYPVQETYTKNSSVTTSTRFFDLQLGISDPGVFDPPSTCQSALTEKMTSDCWIPRSALHAQCTLTTIY